MNILVINAGSSSLKYQLFDMTGKNVMSKGLCERIGIDGRVKHNAGDKELIHEVSMKDHFEAMSVVIGLLTDKEYGVIGSMSEIGAVGHRIVHGGERFNKSVLIDDEVLAGIEECVALAPLHNPPSLSGIRACMSVMGGIPQAAVFDTAFHQSIPRNAHLYAIPYEYYEKYKIRRYGFHGTSVRYVSGRAAEILGKPQRELKLIVCHMGNGSSVTAVDGGLSVDSSMGFTPLEGIPMGTRSGNIDPMICEYLVKKEGISISEVMDILNKKSGVLGVSGVSSDFRDLDQAAKSGNERAKTALEIFVHAARKTIGAFAAVMGGCDAIVFTAGIGENNTGVRQRICENLEYMGFELDNDRNRIRGQEAVISSDASKGKLLVIPTNEELVIALDTEAIIGTEGGGAFVPGS